MEFNLVINILRKSIQMVSTNYLISFEIICIMNQIPFDLLHILRKLIRSVYLIYKILFEPLQLKKVSH
jgi:hypothetical protein